MKRLIGPVVATLVVATLPVAALAEPPALAASSAHRAAAPPRVLTCAGRAVVEPASYILTCADANTSFAGIRWASWGPTSATANGTFVENTCEPSCAAGRYVKYPGTLTLSKPEQTKYGELFSVVHYSYTVSGSMTLPLRPL